MPKLLTHVLDTSRGQPAADVNIVLFAPGPAGSRLIKSVVPNTSGRTDELLLDSDKIQPGNYKILYYIGDYLVGSNSANCKPYTHSKPLCSLVPILVTIENSGANFLVPLLVKPWSYSTYRDC
jgi:5-hydroxyisourate hydrolase